MRNFSLLSWGQIKISLYRPVYVCMCVCMCVLKVILKLDSMTKIFNDAFQTNPHIWSCKWFIGWIHHSIEKYCQKSNLIYDSANKI